MVEAIVYIGQGSRSVNRNQQFIAFIKETMEKVECPIQENRSSHRIFNL